MVPALAQFWWSPSLLHHIMADNSGESLDSMEQATTLRIRKPEQLDGDWSRLCENSFARTSYQRGHSIDLQGPQGLYDLPLGFTS